MAEVRGEVKREINPQKITRIDRVAEDEDVKKAQKHREKEKEAFSLCKERIDFHGLEMKLLAVHYLHDEQKILFFFSADNRIDFRTLVKDLVGIFRCRIELRQIAARDESRIGGGFGICGRCYCCASISDKLKPVSIKMAKEQNLSLNTAKISGPCGRLLCCLSYEHVFYSTERHNMPGEGSRIMLEGEPWRVKEVNPICGCVTITTEDGRQMQIASNRLFKTDNKWHVGKPVAEGGGQ
jgi:cell fate regulator YaaT (PSP1 superfamily)